MNAFQGSQEVVIGPTISAETAKHRGNQDTGGNMESVANPETGQPLKNALASRLHAASVRRLEQRLTRDGSRSVVADKKRETRIRAWRADTEVSKAAWRANGVSGMPDAKSAGPHPAAATPAGPRPNGSDRAARMRAIEQAWKAERARQVELEPASAESEAQYARWPAEGLETKRQADERIRLALERAKRFRAEVNATGGEKPRSGVDRDRAGRPRERAGKARTRASAAAGRATAGSSARDKARHAKG